MVRSASGAGFGTSTGASKRMLALRIQMYIVCR